MEVNVGIFHYTTTILRLPRTAGCGRRDDFVYIFILRYIAFLNTWTKTYNEKRANLA